MFIQRQEESITERREICIENVASPSSGIRPFMGKDAIFRGKEDASVTAPVTAILSLRPAPS